MRPVGFEPTIPASARPQIYDLDRAATGIGISNVSPSLEPDNSPSGQKEVISQTIINSHNIKHLILPYLENSMV
jgi:hypothetical protein